MESKQLEQSRCDFQRLVEEGSLPAKMEIKLHYLQASIAGHQLEPKQLDLLPQFEKLSLQMMNTEAKTSLFTSIVKCLSGREVVVYFTAERVLFKKDDSTSRSASCYISCNTNSLIISRNKEATDVWHSFLIERLLVAKLYHQEKRKYFFGIAYENVKYRFKYDQEGPCARIHAALLSAIREKRSVLTQPDSKPILGESRMREELEMHTWDETRQQHILQQEKMYLHSLIQKISSSDISNNEGFQLARNIEGGKIMTNSTKNMVKVLMFLERCTIEDLIESYIQFGSWNVQVDSFKIIKKIRNNTFIGNLKLKKKGYFTAAREAFFVVNYFKLCPCLGTAHQPEGKSVKHYLMMSQLEQNEDISGVPMNFNQIVELSEVEGRPGVVFLNLLSQIDFNVYSYLQNTLDMHLQFVEELGSISVLCHERLMMPKNKRIGLFDFGICVCDRRKLKEHFILPEGDRKDQRKNSGLSEISKDFPQPEQEQGFCMPLKQLTKVIADNHNFKMSERIVDIISQKMYEYYYLKQHFSQAVNDEPYVSSDYHLKERVNFLSLGKKWKFTSSEDFVYIDEEDLKLQKGILKLIVKQVASNLKSGKSIMSMTLPVQIFDDFSTLEFFSWAFGFVPVFMNKALKETSLEEQIKYVAVPFMFLFACTPKISKPFNPILGQTCECSIAGIPFYMEQVSHHPPVSAFLMKTDKFQVSGLIDILVDVGLNSAHSKIPHSIKVKIYSNNTEYLIKLPECDLTGIMFGDRVLVETGIGYVLEKNSGTYLEYSIGKDRKKLYEFKPKLKKPDIGGGVFMITKTAVQRLLAIDHKKSVEGIKPEEVIEKYSLITGKWYGDVYFDGVCYKSVKNGPFPVELERPTILLPSDCLFRLDIVYRRWRNFKKSNEEKEVLQTLQRKDKLLREKWSPTK